MNIARLIKTTKPKYTYNSETETHYAALTIKSEIEWGAITVSYRNTGEELHGKHLFRVEGQKDSIKIPL